MANLACNHQADDSPSSSTAKLTVDEPVEGITHEVVIMDNLVSVVASDPDGLKTTVDRIDEDSDFAYTEVRFEWPDRVIVATDRDLAGGELIVDEKLLKGSHFQIGRDGSVEIAHAADLPGFIPRQR